VDGPGLMQVQLGGAIPSNGSWHELRDYECLTRGFGFFGSSTRMESRDIDRAATGLE
jgi:hypothetical protein